MKLSIFLLIFVSMFLVSCGNNLEDIPKISKGTLDHNCKNENETMKFKVQLPKDWNFVDKSHGITNYIPISQNLSQNIWGNEEITISKKFTLSDESSIFQLFSISKNTGEEIRNGKRKVNLGFALVSSQKEIP